jgi:hypothetical protein
MVVSSVEHLRPGFHTQAPSRDFRCDGLVVLKGFLNRCETTAIRKLIESVLRLPCETACRRPHNTLLPLPWNDKIVQWVPTSRRRMQVLNDGLRADDLKWISLYISLKEGLIPDSSRHLDRWCWDHPASYQREVLQLAALCYLMGTSVHNGALRVLLGLHLRNTSLHWILPKAHGSGMEELESMHIATSDLPDQETIELNVGEAVAVPAGPIGILQRFRLAGSEAVGRFRAGWRDEPADFFALRRGGAPAEIHALS